MKRHTLNLVALGAVLLTAGFALGQSQTAAPAPAAAPKTQKLVLVRTLDGVKANQDFQHDVQIMQSERQNAVDLTTAVEKEKDAKKKKDLKAQLDTLMTKLKTDDAAMQKAYGFSITRNYSMEVEKSNIYMLVSDEEAAKIEQAQKAQKTEQDKKAKK